MAMRINSAILSQRVSDKLTNACMSSIVSKAMIAALPLTEEDVAQEALTFTKYTTKVVKSLHGETLLSRAMEAYQDNTNALNYLISIQDCVTPVVEAATKRIVKENAKAQPEDMQKIIDEAAFTKEEMATFAKRGKDLDLSTVSGIVKDKVIKTLKSEKENFELSKKLEDDINTTIASVEDEDSDDTIDNLNATDVDEDTKKPSKKKPKEDVDPEEEDTTEKKKPAAEALMDVLLDKCAPRKPVTFFSKLYETCMESLSVREDFEGEISLDALVDTTLNHTLQSFEHYNHDIESALEATLSVDPEHRPDPACIGPKAMIMAIVITTVLETLKTMRLYSPSMNEIKSFVDRPSRKESMISLNGNELQNQLIDRIKYANNLMKDPKANESELNACAESLLKIATKLEAVREEVLPNKTELTKLVGDTQAKMTSALANIDRTATENAIGYFTKKMHDENVASFNRVNRTISRRKDINSVVLEVSNTTPLTDRMSYVTIPVKMLSKSGVAVESATMVLKVNSALGSVAEEMFSAATESTIRSQTIPCSVYYTDGCYKVPLINEDSI